MNRWLRLNRTDVPKALTDDEAEEWLERLNDLVDEYRENWSPDYETESTDDSSEA